MNLQFSNDMQNTADCVFVCFVMIRVFVYSSVIVYGVLFSVTWLRRQKPEATKIKRKIAFKMKSLHRA